VISAGSCDTFYFFEVAQSLRNLKQPGWINIYSHDCDSVQTYLHIVNLDNELRARCPEPKAFEKPELIPSAPAKTPQAEQKRSSICIIISS
jgi:hypothetical protein